VRVGSHHLLVEAVDQLDAFLDQLRVFHYLLIVTN
jgi:hypothetical protein